ncbi:MAG: response regulator [Thermodesulfobacteriota bacterium]
MASKGSVLVVDDEPDIGFVLCTLLEKWSYRAEVATGSEQALRYLGGQRFDVLVTDIRMPGIGGIELLRLARELGPDLQCVMMSAYDDSRTAIEALRLDAVNFLSKPINFQELESAVEKAMDRLRLVQDARKARSRERMFEAANAHLGREMTKNRMILDSAGEGILGLDSQGTVIFVNPAANSMLGWDPGEAVGRSFEEELCLHTLGDGAPFPDRLSPFQRAYQDGRLQQGSGEIFWRKDGTCLPIEYTCTPLEDGEGIYGAVVVFRDISERRAIERQIRRGQQMQEVLNSLLRLSLDTTSEADLLGRCLDYLSSLSWLDLDPKGAAFLLEEGTSTLVLTAEVGLERRHAGGCQRVALGDCLCGTAAQTGQLVYAECPDARHQSRCRHTQPHSHYCVPMVSSRQGLLGVMTVYGRHGAGRNPQVERLLEAGAATVARIIENMRAQKALAAAEAAVRARSEFMARLSHEIRTPMNGVIGMTNLALGLQLPAQAAHYLQLVKSSAGRLLTIINDILDFSKMEAGKLRIDPVPFSLRDMLQGTLEGSLAIQAADKGLSLSWSLDPCIPDTLVGDPGRLLQILVNLVGNAIKFTEQGRIEVLVEPGPTAAEDGDGLLLHFAVRDTGVGIALDQQAELFNPFFQCDSSLTRRHGGTGLGLAISAQLVDLLGGRIWLESTPGQGSTFHFSARFASHDEDAPAPGRTLPDQGLDASVLVLEAAADSEGSVSSLLSGWVANVRTVASGPAALAAFRQQRHAVVLLDADVAGVGVFDLAEEILGDPRLGRPLVMILASAGIRGDAAQCREIEVAGYLTKPVQRPMLLEAISMAMEGGNAAGVWRPFVTRHTVREAQQECHVLLVEDEFCNRTIAASLIEQAGWRVTAVDNGRRAVEILQQTAFDLVLMDVQMPVLDGLAATAAIRQQEGPTGGHVPIVAMTAHAMPEDRQRCLAAGMDAYISKPIEPMELYATARRLLRDGAARRGSAEQGGRSAAPGRPRGKAVAAGVFSETDN